MNTTTTTKPYHIPENMHNNPEAMIVANNGMKMTWHAYLTLKEIHHNTMREFVPAYMEE